MKQTFLIIFISLILAGFGGITAEECPKANIIKKMSSDMASYKAVLPLDYSRIKSSGAMMKKDGTGVEVCLSNGDFTTLQMSSSLVVPIKKKNEFIAVINFTNGKDKVMPGTYSPAAGFRKPFWVIAEVKLYQGDKGVIVSLGVREGTATIVEITEDRICGRFDLRTKAGAAVQGEITGEFNVKLQTSKW